MAVVQISRIQVRRGRKGNADVPTLASGEIGWAIDQQELFIGNGAVSEGAPATGNTRILTEHDNLFDLIGSYTFSNTPGSNITTGETPSEPVERSIQEKLDDVVSVRDFGAYGDGTDQTVIIQRAIDELFLSINSGGQYRNVELRVPAGQYIISAPLNIPPWANIVGDGKENTVFVNANSDTVFRMVNSSWVPDSSGSQFGTESLVNVENRSRKVNISGITIEHNGRGPAILLRHTADSTFDDLEIYSTVWDFTVGDGIWQDGAQDLIMEPFKGIATEFLVEKTALINENNKISNCNFQNLVCAIDMPHNSNSNIIDKCKFESCGFGTVFGEIDANIGDIEPTRSISDVSSSPKYNIIRNSLFDNIYRQAWKITKGGYNRSDSNTYLNVGNEGASSAGNAWPILSYFDYDNTSENDFFKRTQELSMDYEFFNTDNTPLDIDGFADFKYYPEVEGNYDYKNNFPLRKTIGTNESVVIGDPNDSSLSDSSFEKTFMYIPSVEDRGFIEIDYNYVFRIKDVFDNPISENLRKGKITIQYSKFPLDVQINDEYTFTGDDTRADLLTFTASFDIDRNGNRPEIISLKALNTMISDGENVSDTFTCTISQRSSSLI